mgnify:CR=1 FL=1
MNKRLIAMILCLGVPAIAWADAEPDVEPGFNEATFKGLAMRSIGPAFMSGRISDIVMDPEDPSTWYVGVGSGGVWKTTNAGTTWTQVFDDQGSYSIGCVTIDPSNPNTIWVGTGENVSGRHVGYGDGVYKSIDGGKTWTGPKVAFDIDDSQHGFIPLIPRGTKRIYAFGTQPIPGRVGDRSYRRMRRLRPLLGPLLGRVTRFGTQTGADRDRLDPILDACVATYKEDLDEDAQVRFKGGAKGMLWASQVAPGNENALRIRVYGETGGLEWAQEDPNYLWHTPFGEPKRLITRNGAGAGADELRANCVPCALNVRGRDGADRWRADCRRLVRAAVSGGNAHLTRRKA